VPVTSSTNQVRVPPASDTASALPPTKTRCGRRVRHVDRLDLSFVDDVVVPVPSTFRQAMQHPQWHQAMADEHQPLVDNITWSLVPRLPRANVITGKWIYRHKFHYDGTLAPTLTMMRLSTRFSSQL
jgi:hypothetical protein